MSLKLSYAKLEKALIFAFVFLVLNTRPAVFGSLFNETFLLLPMVGLIVLRLGRKSHVRLTKTQVVLLTIVFIYIAWVFLQILLLDPGNLYIGLVVIITIPIVVLGTITFIGDSGKLETALKSLVFIIALLSLSQLLTYTLFLLDMRDSVLISEIYIRGDDLLPLRLYFPFTPTYHFVKIAGQIIDRSVGFWREPGLYQLFIITSFFALDFISVKRKKFLRVLFIFSLIVTFSTAGYAIFLGCLTYKYLLLRRMHVLKKIPILLIIIVVFIAFNRISYFGLSDKLDRNEKRLLSPLVSWELLWRSPLMGQGITSEEEFVSGVKLGVNLLSSVHKQGLIGLSLLIAILLYSTINHYKLTTMTLLFPIFMTMLIAQPVYMASFTFFMLFLPTKGLQSTQSISKPRISDLSPVSTRPRPIARNLRAVDGHNLQEMVS